jgi:twinkle protein
MADIIDFPGPAWPDVFWLGHLPQRPPVTDIAFGTGVYGDLDQILKFYPGQFVVLTGRPGSGKSTFILNVLARMARYQGVKSFLYVPENEGNIMQKMRGIWGVTDEHLEKGFRFYMDCYFRILSSYLADGPRTLGWILDRAEQAVYEDGLRVVLIDPWNEIERVKPKDVQMTDYIGECLGAIKDSARRFGYTAIMVAHPTKPSEDGKLPGLYSIEGSANWYNKCDNGLIVERKGNGTQCHVISAKVREVGAGTLGEVWFNVDPNTGVFSPV